MSKKIVDATGRTLQSVNAEIKQAVEKNEVVTVENADRLHGVAGGMRGGSVIINGSVGDYVAVLNTGARIVIRGDAGRFVADNMTSGEVVVEGSCGYGSGMGMYGGTLIVRGNSGDYTGVINKGGTIIVCGDVGGHVGVYMVGGDIVVCGGAGDRLGDWMIHGNIYVMGEAKSLGHNSKMGTVTPEDVTNLQALFARYMIKGNPEEFRKVIPERVRPFYGKSVGG